MSPPVAASPCGGSAIRAGALSDSKAFFQLARHAEAHLQRRLAAAQVHAVLAVGAALDAFQVLDPDQGVAVDAHEGRAELALEQPQRVVDEVLAAGMPHRGVLLVGEEINTSSTRERLQPFAL